MRIPASLLPPGPCVHGKMNGISGMSPKPKSLTSAALSVAPHSSRNAFIIKMLAEQMIEAACSLLSM